MKISIVAPIRPGTNTGNRVTASRWAKLLCALGHEVTVEPVTSRPDCDLLIALHAGHAAQAVLDFRKRFPAGPIVVGMGGTDLYQDIRRSRSAQKCLDAADRIVLLQSRAVEEIPEPNREKCRVIYQSVDPPSSYPKPIRSHFEVCVIGHLRPVKDPFRAAMAARKLPESSRIRIVHIGGALSDSMQHRAEKEMASNSRYRWLGELTPARTRSRLLRSRALVHSSKTEGGANVISEAIVGRVPVLSSRIPGSVGLLGEDYPGYFETGDTAALTELLCRIENDADFRRSLERAIRGQRSLFRPQRERDSWRRLLKELSVPRAQVTKTRSAGRDLSGAAAVRDALRAHIDPKKAAFYPRFFKAGKGEYAEGDKFIGVTVPNQRKVARRFKALELADIEELLADPIHEHRLTGLLILVGQFQKATTEADRERLLKFYLQHLDAVNNWDLVDASAHKILGEWLVDHDRGLLDGLAESGRLWRERVSVIACLPLIQRGEFAEILGLSAKFLDHPRDLMHKAVGWMLRETGKQDVDVLREFLRQHADRMPRTMLRYAIEKLPEQERRAWLSGTA